jgi:hypothetical protein
LTVTVDGVAIPLVLAATGTADVATQMTVFSGNNQSAFAGAPLGAALMFKVGDKFNNGIAGSVVSFSVVAGGGNLPPGSVTVTADANGVAIAPIWTLGKTTGSQQLRGTSGTFTATASATVTSNYTLEVRFFGPTIDPTIQAAFTTAAARIQGLLVGDVPNATVSNLSVATTCNAPGVANLSETIDDLIVFAQVATIDGPGGILGSAGPCFVRDPGGQPLVGVMNFDVADIQGIIGRGHLNDVILHEMLHTVGFGTRWATLGQLSGTAQGGNLAFIGQQAVASCLFHGGTATNQCGSGTVPVEFTGGAGTAGSHWRENTSASGIGFNTELMTGFEEGIGIAMPLSRMSIASLADIGYTVNLFPFDTYTVPSTAAVSIGLIREAQGLGKFELKELLTEPVAKVSLSGQVTLIKPRR